jgi:hypothetical protein
MAYLTDENLDGIERLVLEVQREKLSLFSIKEIDDISRRTWDYVSMVEFKITIEEIKKFIRQQMVRK